MRWATARTKAAPAGGPSRAALIAEIERHTKNVEKSVKFIKNMQLNQGINVLHLCGGVGTAAQALKQAGVAVANHIDVEIDAVSRGIAAENHTMDHSSLPQDLRAVSEEQINELVRKYGAIHLLVCSTPCQGLSRANNKGTGLADPRSGLWMKAVEVLRTLQSHDEQTKYVFENVDFRATHPEDYETTVRQLGTPEYTDAADMSGAARKRLFWHNLGSEQGPKPPGLDANTLLKDGARLIDGATTAPCIMANWRCSHHRCRKSTARCEQPAEHAEHHHMATHKPVLIQQDGATRQITPEEAERLMGLPPGYTAHAKDGEARQTVSNIERLARIGAAMDVNQAAHILGRMPEHVRHSKEHTEIRTGDTQTDVHPHVRPHTEWNAAAIAAWLTAGPLPTGEADPQWNEHWAMRGAEDLVRCCTEGFPLRYEGDRDRHVEQENGATCQDNPQITAEELRKEVAAGHIAGPYATRPLRGFKVTPRGLKEEPTKFRPITMGNLPIGDAVNESIARAEFIHLTRTRDIDRRIRACYARTGEVWMAKADVKAAYRTMPVRPEDWHLQGIKWDNQYYIDLRMSFGCRSSVDQWLRFSDAMEWTMARWGVHAVHYVDDFIFIAASREECEEQLRKFRAMCKAWGVVLKEQEDCGPAQQLLALGVHYDLHTMTRKIAPKRVASLAEDIERAATSGDRKLWERLTGVLWYVVRCAPIGLPFVQPIMETTIRARKSRKPAAPSAGAKRALQWWQQLLTDIGTQGTPWHGETIIPLQQKHARRAMGDAGSEWGMGGHDDTCFFKAKWTPELWEQVQREKATSSLHMEALQLLVMTRIMAERWSGCKVTVELDSLGVVQTLRKGRHSEKRINDILQELATLQMKHGFELGATWVRRCWNEAADALSKDDMERFWRNIEGDRTQIIVTPEHLRTPGDQTHTAGMRRTTTEKRRWEPRPTRHIKSSIALSGEGQAKQLAAQLRDAVTCHATINDPTYAARAGVKHYLRFCMRAGYQEDVAPPIEQMTTRTQMWLADAPLTYRYEGVTKKGISTGSIPVYLSHIDNWWTTTTQSPRGLLSKQTAVATTRRSVMAASSAAGRQVHGISGPLLRRLVQGTKHMAPGVADTLAAAYTLAWYGLLRPAEYMTTPAHPRFDASRHLRAGDIELFAGNRRLDHRSREEATHMTVYIKQSKSDHQRMGATLTLGATHDADMCPVRHMQRYLRRVKPHEKGPLFPGLRYSTMLPMLRRLIGKESELYGLHSFRVGGAQALALAGRSLHYIMAKGRWKHIESVIRYVETPLLIMTADSGIMALTDPLRPTTTQVWGGDTPLIRGGEADLNPVRNQRTV